MSASSPACDVSCCGAGAVGLLVSCCLSAAYSQDFHDMMINFSAVQGQLMQASADMWRTTSRQFAGEPVPPGEEESQDDD